MKLIKQELLGQLIQNAAEAPRQRSHFNVHETPEAMVQKLFVAATKRSYFRPHRHVDKEEFAIVLRGRFAVFCFDEQGNITERHLIGDATDIMGMQLPPNTWHCWLALSDDGVFFETKQGPYDPGTAAEFAPWAPAENTPGVESYMEMLQKAI